LGIPDTTALVKCFSIKSEPRKLDVEWEVGRA
jgi:hypothetical protein